MDNKDTIGERILRDNVTLLEFASGIGQINDITKRLWPEVAFLDKKSVKEISQMDFNSTSIEPLKQIIRDKYSVVGFVEEFDKSLLLMKEKYGWKAVKKSERLNVNKARASVRTIDEGVKQEIRSLNKADCELYVYAKELFDAECKAHGIK